MPIPANVENAVKVLRREGYNNYRIMSMLFRDGLHPLRFTLQDFVKHENNIERLMCYLLDTSGFNGPMD